MWCLAASGVGHDCDDDRCDHEEHENPDSKTGRVGLDQIDDFHCCRSLSEVRSGTSIVGREVGPVNIL